MLLAALLDAGASLEAVRAAVAAVVPGEITVATREVQRTGLRAVRAEVTSAVEAHPHRTWRDVRALLPDGPALAVFARLAAAEGRVHGIDAEDVTFHEVGAWDSIADVVGVCAALADLRVTTVTASPVAL